MKTTQIHLYDAHLFSMLRYLSLRIHRPASKKEIQQAMCLAWTLDPFSKIGAKEVALVLSRAKDHGMIEVENGAGNGARLVGPGLRFLDEAFETRRFGNSPKLQEGYRKAAGLLPAAAASVVDVAA